MANNNNQAPQIAVITVPMSEWENLNNKVNSIYSKLDAPAETETNGLNDFMTAAEFIAQFKICRNVFEKLKRNGILKVYRLNPRKGARVYVKRSEVNELLENGLI